MEEKPSSQQIDDIISMYGGWKGEILSRLRAVVRQADPAVTEEIKWKMRTRPEGLPVWSHNGILCFAETWKDGIKLLFPKGAQLQDPSKLFKARLNSSEIRAVEFREGDTVDEVALKGLVLEAVELNTSKERR